MVTGRARVLLSPPTQTPVPCEGPDLQHWCRSRNPALSACVLEMLLCDSRFYLSCCAPLIILFDLTPKWQVIANERPELRAVVINNNTSVLRLTPRSFWGRNREGWFIPCFREVVDSAFATTPTPISSLSAAFQPMNHQSFTSISTDPDSHAEEPWLHPRAEVLSYTSKPFLAVSSSRHHELGVSLGLASPTEQLTDRSLLYIPHALPKLDCKEQRKKVLWKAAVIEQAISWL